MLVLLQELVAIPSVSGNESPMVDRVARWAGELGLETDVFETREEDVAPYPEGGRRHLSLAGRPTLVVRVKGRGGQAAERSGGGRSLMLNAHADVVPPGSTRDWTVDPWGGVLIDGRIYGRGSCDTKGGLVSAMWAMAMLAESPPRGNVLLELIPGEEDCVGLGTLTSVLRGYQADAVVVLEPTESVPRCASRGGLRFEITCRGRSVHGTMKWHGVDAIAKGRRVLDRLALMEVEYNDRDAHRAFAGYPLARPITVDKVSGGEWQGMVADQCLIGGYLELLPNDDITTWQRKFEADVRDADPEVAIEYPESYTGHDTPSDSEFCVVASRLVGGESAQAMQQYLTGFNSGCEAGLRYREHGTPTLVWGPGTLLNAHAPDENVPWEEVRRVAHGLFELAQAWCT